MKLSIGQIQDYLVQAGWPADKIPTAAAVFMFESDGGDPRAHKVDNIERSYGLAQINLGLPGTKLQRERAHLGTPEDLYNPVYNLQVALDIFRSQGWNAWENTYAGGRYKRYMAASSKAWAERTGTQPEDVQASDDSNWYNDLVLGGYSTDEIAAASKTTSKTTTPTSYDEWYNDLLMTGYTPEEIAQMKPPGNNDTLGIVGLLAGVFILSEIL